MNMITVKENDVYKREKEVEFTLREIITFKQPAAVTYQKEEYDWYMAVALEKSDKVSKDRQLLTADLMISYRWAIREGYNHELDKDLQLAYDHPRNRNTIRGILGYIARIKKAFDDQGNA